MSFKKGTSTEATFFKGARIQKGKQTLKLALPSGRLTGGPPLTSVTQGFGLMAAERAGNKVLGGNRKGVRLETPTKSRESGRRLSLEFIGTIDSKITQAESLVYRDPGRKHQKEEFTH